MESQTISTGSKNEGGRKKAFKAQATLAPYFEKKLKEYAGERGQGPHTAAAAMLCEYITKREQGKILP